MFPSDTLEMLEYPAIIASLAELTRTRAAREKALALMPLADPNEIKQRTAQTLSARKIFDAMGAPPVHSMEGLDNLSDKLRLGQILTAGELSALGAFLTHCRLLRRFMEKAMPIDPLVAAYGLSIDTIEDVREEIERCIRYEEVQDRASAVLYSLRKKQEQYASRIKEKLSSLVRSHPEWFQESYHSLRGGHYVLPVKRECRQMVKGVVRDASASGATVFIEPQSVMDLQQEIELLAIDEQNEIIRILSTLSEMAAQNAVSLSINRQAMEDIDFAFACGRLGSIMNGVAALPTAKREILLSEARHPLLKGNVVPLSIELGKVRGLVITGPNTGGKTVALKTVGLLCLMALSGLLVPAKQAVIPAFRGVYCDIGDGQSVTQNLSTFSSHVTRIVRILEKATGRSLVLLDELGSGTDPQEGMGLAISVLEELGRRMCLVVATSHYPEIKLFAGRAPGFQNARMTFDRRTLSPQYRLESGVAGESCALYIAKRLGVPDAILARAFEAAYPDGSAEPPDDWDDPAGTIDPIAGPADDEEIQQDMPEADIPKEKKPLPGAQYRLGDAVEVPFMHARGVVCKTCNAKGEIGVRIQGRNYTIAQQRVRLYLTAEQLYPDGEYDLDIVLTDWDTRRRKKDVAKGKKGASFVVEPGGDK